MSASAVVGAQVEVKVQHSRDDLSAVPGWTSECALVAANGNTRPGSKGPSPIDTRHLMSAPPATIATQLKPTTEQGLNQLSDRLEKDKPNYQLPEMLPAVPSGTISVKGTLSYE